MNQTQAIPQCPKCGKRLKFAPSQDRGRCPHCSTVVVRTANGLSASKGASPSPPSARFNGRIPHSAPLPPSPSKLRLPAYLWRHWGQSRGSWFLPVFFGVLAVPTLSLLKPIVGFRGLAYSAGGCLALAAGCFVLYLLKQTGAYLLGGERSVTEESSSVLARLAYGGFLFGLFFLGPLAAAEYFTPPAGLLATAVPPLQELQQDLRIVSRPPAVADMDGAEVTDDPAQVMGGGDASRSDPARISEAGPTADDFLPPLDSAASSAADDNAPSVDELLVAQADPGDQDGTEQRPADASVTQSRPSPSSASPVTPKTSSDLKAGENSQVVVAEGAGTSPQEALKDAFREAVRQVVGSVVDAETLIKNDELIDDKVLTYSDGFITKYDKIGETQRGGVVRIKISAVVERRSLVQKLKAANVTVKEIDGSGLFAEALTQLEAEQNAEALLTKSLEGFPLNCLTAEVIGKPELVNKGTDTATIRVRTRFSADLQAYGAFAKKLEQLLEKISSSKGEFSTKASVKRIRFSSAEAGFPYFQIGNDEKSERYNVWPALIPGLSPQHKAADSAVIALNLQQTEAMDRGEWRYFVVDLPARTPLAAKAACIFTAKLSLVDEGGRLVAVDRFPASTNNNTNRAMGGDYHASLVFAGIGSSDAAYDGFYYGYGNDGQKTGFFEPYYQKLVGGPNGAGTGRHRGEQLFLIAPFFFQSPSSFRDCAYISALELSRDITLSLDELKNVHAIRCELQFNGELQGK